MRRNVNGAVWRRHPVLHPDGGGGKCVGAGADGSVGFRVLEGELRVKSLESRPGHKRLRSGGEEEEIEVGREKWRRVGGSGRGNSAVARWRNGEDFFLSVCHLPVDMEMFMLTSDPHVSA